MNSLLIDLHERRLAPRIGIDHLGRNLMGPRPGDM